MHANSEATQKPGSNECCYYLNERTLDSLWFLGLAFLIVPSVTLIAFVFLSVLGMTASPLPFLIAIGSSLACLVLGMKKLDVGRITISLFVAGFCLTIIFFTALSNYVLDNSWDGLNYHQAYALRMLGGWNIFYSMDGSENSSDYFGGKFLEHLPFLKTEGFEAITACWASVAGSIEGGKAQNFVMLLAAWLASFRFFSEIVNPRRYSTLAIVLLSSAAALNPIVICQVFTNYVDGMFASSALVLLSSLGLLLVKPSMRTAWIAAALASIVIFNVKNSTLAFAVCTFAICGVASWFTFKGSKPLVRRFVLFSFLTLILGLPIVGAYPTLYNVIAFVQSPKEKLEKYRFIIKQNYTHAPPEFATIENPLEQFVLSLICEPDNYQLIDKVYHYDRQAQKEHPNLNLYIPEEAELRTLPPFFVDIEALHNFESCDLRIGGFGPWFAEALGFAFVMFLLWILRTFSKGRCEMSASEVAVLALCCTIVISTATTPMSWWSRYVAQFWLLPSFLAALCLARNPDEPPVASSAARRATIGLAVICCMTSIISSSIVMVVNWSSNLKRTSIFRQELKAAYELARAKGTPVLFYAQDPGWTPGFGARLSENGIAWRKTTQRPSPKDRCFRIFDQEGLFYISSGDEAP